MKEIVSRIFIISERVSDYFVADEQDWLFHSVFQDIRQKIKGLKEELSQKAKDSLQKELIEDLKDKGYEVVSVVVSLGKYRGSHFITSAKVSVKVKSGQQANELAKHLQKYSPKFSLKSLEDGIALYNIR